MAASSDDAPLNILAGKAFFGLNLFIIMFHFYRKTHILVSTHSFGGIAQISIVVSICCEI